MLTNIFKGEKLKIYKCLFLLTILIFLVPFKIFSFEDSYSKISNEEKSELNNYISIQQEIDKIILQLRSSKTARVCGAYIPSYGIIFHLDYNQNVFPPYKASEGNESEKQNYIEMASFYNSILKRIHPIKNLKPDDIIIVEIICKNIFIQRKIKFKDLKNLYSSYSDFNILQSLLKLESDRENSKNKVIKSVEENISCFIFDLDSTKVLPLKISQEIETSVKKNLELNVVVTYLPELGGVIQTIGQASEASKAKEALIDLSNETVGFAEKYFKTQWLIIAVRKYDGVVQGKLDMNKINKENIGNDISWLELDYSADEEKK